MKKLDRRALDRTCRHYRGQATRRLTGSHGGTNNEGHEQQRASATDGSASVASAAAAPVSLSLSSPKKWA
jgi:hypothetical protein